MRRACDLGGLSSQIRPLYRVSPQCVTMEHNKSEVETRNSTLERHSPNDTAVFDRCVDGRAELGLSETSVDTPNTTRKSKLIKYSREELLALRPELPKKKPEKVYTVNSNAVKRLTHKEMVEALESGLLSVETYYSEMNRRKIARDQRKTLKIKRNFVVSNGTQRVPFVAAIPTTAAAEEVFDLPLSMDAFDAMYKLYCLDKPFWKKKMDFYKRMFSEEEFLQKLNSAVNSLYAKGTTEYFVDLLWGSRRLRDKFMDIFESEEVATVQCAEPEVEPIRTNPDLFIVYEDGDFDFDSDLADFWDDSGSDVWDIESASSDSSYEFMMQMAYSDDVGAAVLEEHRDWRIAELWWDHGYTHLYGDWYEYEYAESDDLWNFDADDEDDDDHCVVQSDEPVLEEEASIAGNANITFLEERPTDTDSSHISAEISAHDTQCSMAETPWSTIKSILEREVMVHRGVWTEVDHGEILSLGIPKLITDKNSFVRRQLELVAFLRAGVELRIQFNGNKFAAGKMVFAILPPMFQDDVQNYNYVQSFNWPHVELDAAVSNVGTLFVPFTHILSHFPQQSGSLESDGICTLGRLVAYVINPLHVGEGASNELSYVVYARFVNPEVHQTTWQIQDFSYSNGIIAQAGGEGEGLFKKIVGGGLSTALGAFLSKMTGGLATGLGSLLTGLVFDYPHDPSPPEHVVNRTGGPLCYGAGVDHSTRLTLSPVSQRELSPDILGSTDGDFNIRTLLKIPSLVQITRWRAADTPGTNIFTMPVTPMFLGVDRSGYYEREHVARYLPTMQAYVCRGFCYWKGGMVLRIETIKTEYNNGRLLVVYTPQETPSAVPPKDEDLLEAYTQANAVIIDIEEQKVVEIELPYMSPRPWLRCDAFRNGFSYRYNEKNFNTQDSYLGESYCGFVQIFVLNKLVSPSNVPQDVDVNIYMYVMDDFEVAYPTTLAPLNVKSFGQGSFGGYQEYPFQIFGPNESVTPVNQTDYENRDWIMSLYKDGERLFHAGKIGPYVTSKSDPWYKFVPVNYLGSSDDEAVTWAYKVSLMNHYFDNDDPKTIQQWVMEKLPTYKAASVQGIEEYTAGRQKGPISVTSTKGARSCEIAPSTISENGMNLQTVLRRFYCIYNSVPIYAQTGYTVISIPVNPSFVPILRYPVPTTSGMPGYGEPLPVDHLAWFCKLYTYWSGSTRWKIFLDKSFFDVVVVHVPTECRPWSVRHGIKEIDVQRLMAFAGTVAVSQVQGCVEVEVPYASPYNQLFVDVHNKFFDLRCQNGTLFVMFRNKTNVDPKLISPSSFSIYRSTGEDFMFNLLRPPPLIEEPRMIFGACADSYSTPVTVTMPEVARNLGNLSQKIPMPGSTGIKRVDKLGYFAVCPADKEESTEEKAEVQMFDTVRNAIAEVSKTHSVIQDTAINLKEALAGAKLGETLASLNSVSSKIDSFVSTAESTAKGFNASNETVQRYALLASEVVLCGAFVHQVKTVLMEPTLPNFITLGIEFGLIVGLTVSETLQSLLTRVVDWAMNFPVLNKPEQARAQAFDEATDFLDEHMGVVCTVVAVLGTVMYGYLFGVLPSFSKIKEVIQSYFEDDEDTPAKTQSLEKAFGINLRNAHFSLLGLGALEKVYNKLVEWIQRLLFWMMDKENPEVVLARAAGEVRDRVLELIKELDELDYEPHFIAAMEDPLVHNRFYRLQDEVHELTRLCTNSRIDQRIVVLLAECRRRTLDLIKRLESEDATHTVRYDPFVICIHGESRTGKTRFAEKIFQIYREVMNLPVHHLVYSKNIRDDYWSGYTKQPVVFWDEYAQSKEADKVSVAEFMTLRGDKPVKVNMASLADKGRDFTSQGIVMTTNVPYQTFNSIRDNQAHNLRRHVMIGMRHRPGFDGNILTEANHDAFPNWEHCEFSLTERERNVVIRGDMTMQEILDHVREKMEHHHANQLAKLAQVEAFRLPRGVIPNPDAEELVLGAEAAMMADQAARAVAPLVVDEDREEVFSDASNGDSLLSAFRQVDEMVNPVDEPELDDLDDPLAVQALEDVVSYFIIDPTENLSQAEKFAADMFLARCETARKAQLVATYCRARRTIARKTSKFFELAKSTFDGMIETVKKFWNENPKLFKMLGVFTLLGGVSAIMHFRSKPEAEHYESGPARAPARRVFAEGNYESGPTRPSRTRVVPEGSEDVQANEIARKVSQYVYPLQWREGSTRAAKLNCLHVGGHIVLAPWHFFNHAKEGEWFEVKHRVHPVIVEFKKANMYQIEGKDWVLYNCGVRLEAGKQMSKFFIDEFNLGKVRQASCMLLTRDTETGDIVRDCGRVVPQQSFRYDDDNWGDTYIQTGWKHNLNTFTGQCGGPLVVCSSSMPSPGKIVGIHTAGFQKKSIGYCVLITRQMLERGLQTFGPLPGEAPLPQCVEVGLSDKLRLIPDGDFTIVGVMPNSMAPAQPLKTTFVETPFQPLAIEEIGPVPKIPAMLRPFEVNGERISPLKKAIVKYGHLTIPFPSRNIRKVENFFVHMFDQRLTHHTGRRVFSISEAVNGLPGVDFAEKMNMKSSPGWPYQMENKKPGKWHLFDAYGNIVDDSVSQRLEERRAAAQELRRVPSVWRDCMKDELRPVKKVMSGKTRLFTIAPVDFTILTRQMFLDFVMAFYSSYGGDFFSAVGINPESTDWTELYNYLAEFNSQVIAGDYECFDGKEMPEIMMSVCNVINAWYADSTENQNVRQTLFLEMIHTMQLCENLVYMTHQGNPSGNPLTTVINTIVNVFLLVLAWLEIFPDKTVDDFFTNVRVKAYGDDNLIAPKNKFLTKFNQNTIAETLLKHNIVYTAETKSGEIVPNSRPLKEVSFLKRGFRKDPVFGNLFHLPTMSVETLNSYFYYYRFSTLPEEQIQENQRSALCFAAFHGEKFYNDYLSKWKRFMASCGMESLQISFEEQVDVFQYGAGMLEFKPKNVFYNKIEIEGFEKFMQITNSKPVRSVLGAIEAPFYYIAACLGIGASEPELAPTDDRWAVAIPSGEGKSTLARLYPWLFVDHDDLLLPLFEKSKKGLPWKAEVAREYDFPQDDRRVLLVHHPSFTKRRLVGSFVTPFPTFIRINCLQRLRLKDPMKMSMNERNILLVQLCTLLEPNLKRCELKLYTHASPSLNQPAGDSVTQKARQHNVI